MHKVDIIAGLDLLGRCLQTQGEARAGGGGGAVDLNIYNAAPLSLTTPFRCFSGNSSRRHRRPPHRHRHR